MNDEMDEMEIEIPQKHEHPYKAILKRSGLKNWQIARICNISYGYMSQILNGHVPMPARVDERLQALMKRIDKSNLYLCIRYTGNS